MEENTVRPLVTEDKCEKTVRPFGLRDKLGYLFGDLGNDFFFIL